MTLTEMKRHYQAAKKAYYNKDAIISDAEFDRLENKIRKLEPTWSPLEKTGVPVADKKTKTVLTHFMPSLAKFYPSEVNKKATDTAYVAMDKLDGSSLQLTVKDGKPVKLVTRGDGTIGGDISFLIPHLNLPVGHAKGTQVFRCEAVMKEATFIKKWLGKDPEADVFDNSRAMCNGLLNRKKPHPGFKDIDIVVLGAFGHSIRDGLKLAKVLGLPVVAHTVIDTVEDWSTTLTEHLAQRKDNSLYNIDGLVLAPLTFTLTYASNAKPKSIFAFKFNDEDNAAVVTVKRIVWQLSGRGRLIPKIEIEPTEMDGVMVTYCTAHNARWMVDHGIGPGAKIKVLRSGGVIPKIVASVTKGRFQPPEQAYTISGVHFVVAGTKLSSNSIRTIGVKNLSKFMTTLGIEFIASKTLDVLYDALPSPLAYIKAWDSKKLSSIMLRNGLGEKQTPKIVAEFDRIFDSPIKMKTLMVALQCFDVGVGERKLSMIEDAGISMGKLTARGHFMRSVVEETVKGFSEKSTNLIMDGMPAWKELYTAIDPILTIDGTLPEKRKSVKGKMTGLKVSFTGYRDKEQEAAIVAAGGDIVSFGGSTQVLIFKAGGKESSKVDKASAKGIKVSTFAELGL